MYNSACCVRDLHINCLQWQNVIYSNSLIILFIYLFFYSYIYSLNPSLCTGTLDVEHVKIVDTT
jgi:hypothetical protein